MIDWLIDINELIVFIYLLINLSSRDYLETKIVSNIDNTSDYPRQLRVV